MTAVDSLLMGLLLAGLGGLLVGSFLNVVAYRLPRRESLLSPGSHCPGCQAPVRPYDNVPILSWVMLHGRCRACREPISVRYPLVEATCAGLAVAVVAVKHTPHDVALGLVLIAVLVPTALIDFDHRIIPNRLLAPAALAALIIGAATAPAELPEQLIAGAGAGGFLLVFALAYPRGMGMGDVKLAAVLGLFLGRSVAVALLIGVLAGVMAGIAVMSRAGVAKGRKTAIAFGPFLALGGVVGLLAGPALTDLYLHTLH